jgi:deferrochelatase/peroxidase EfeB
VAALQEGIYAGPGRTPGDAFAIVFLRAERSAGAGDLHETLVELSTMLRDLTRGRVRALPGHPVPSADLTALFGYGPKVFAVEGVRRALPERLGPRYRFRSPVPTGGGVLLAGSGLAYASDITRNDATEELCLQFVAGSTLAVSRAVVETWKLLRARRDPATGAAALEIAGLYTGFQREDRRSWIDFHDGVSNLRSSDRERVVSIGGGDAGADAWTLGGTYLAFLRVAVELSVWEDLGRPAQELLVGRDKLTGSPLVGRDAEGRPLPDPRCPVAGTAEVTDPGNEDFREPDDTDDPVVAASHVQRANRFKSAPPEQPNSLRIFRQGFEFLEPAPVAPGFRVGLNFVSFQDTPDRLLRMLTQDGWLGGVSFGGSPQAPEPAAPHLLSVRAGGIYLVPPVVEGEAYPGAGILA